ncbi:MAG: hypothetical protein LAO20_06720 [Acidobacteriia bacterium]|nr:hypothetical protein [Terriglobia bacterium]
MTDSTTEARRHGEDNGNRRVWHSSGSYQGTSFSHAVEIKNIWALASAVLRSVAKIAVATLREIFDESAYERFLTRTQSARSVESYRAFLGERESSIVSKPRCC